MICLVSNLLCSDLTLLLFYTVFYSSSPITVHHMVGCNMGIRGFADFHFPCPTSLYSYDDEDITNLFILLVPKPLENYLLVPHFQFSDMDRTMDKTMLPKPHIWGCHKYQGFLNRSTLSLDLSIRGD